MPNSIRKLAALAAALTLTACAQTVSGHGAGRSGAAPASGSSGPTGFPATSPTSPSGGTNGDLSADALARAAKHAMQSATAFRMTGSGSDNGALLRMDIHYGATSSDGSITFAGNTVQLRYVRPDMYMKAGAKFWRQVGSIGSTPSARDRAALKLLKDKWVHLPENTSGLGQLAQLAVRTEVVKQAGLGGGTYSKGPDKTIDGVPAVSFVDAADGSTVYVPATGTPYPIRIENPKPAGGGSLDLTDWNVPFSAPRPPASEVVELPH
jgi:hypothetical protein